MKGLYGMLGLEYRDTDSEEEGEGPRATEDVNQLTDDLDNGDDDCGADDDDYVVFDLGGKEFILFACFFSLFLILSK